MIWALKHWMCLSWFCFKSGQKLEHIVLGIVLLCKSSTYRFKVSSLLCWQLDIDILQIWESHGCIFIFFFFFSFMHHLLYFTIHKFTIWTDHLSHQPSMFTVFTPTKQNSRFSDCDIVRKHCSKTKHYSMPYNEFTHLRFVLWPTMLTTLTICYFQPGFYVSVFFFLICNMAAGMSEHMGHCFQTYGLKHQQSKFSVALTFDLLIVS